MSTKKAHSKRRIFFGIGLAIVCCIAGLTILTVYLIDMGLFDKLFGKKVDEARSPTTEQMHPSYEENWAVYFSWIDDDKVGSIMVDLGLKTLAPVDEKPYLLRVSIKMNNPREDGLSSTDESGTLNEIDHKVTQVVTARHNATYAGRVNGGGMLRLHFYLADIVGYEEALSEVISAYPKYEIKYELSEDKAWQLYLNGLFPEPIEMQSIQNGLVIENLERSGDTLEKERLVEHWIYFKNESDRERFLERIEEMKFEVVRKVINEESKERPYELVISRKDKVDFQSVDSYVLPLWQIAGECNGEYDGWETFVVRD